MLTRLALAIAAVALLTGCPDPTPPSRTDAVIDFGQFHLDLGQQFAGRVDRQFVFYAGAPVESFHFNLKVTGLASAQGKISVGNADGTLIEGITTDGDHATGVITGNVGRLRVETVQPTDIVVESLAVTKVSGNFFPTVVEMSNRVSAFPLKINGPVDIAFPAEPTSYYFSIVGLQEGFVDIGYFGAGRLRIAQTNDPNFPLSDDFGTNGIPDTGSSVPFTRVNAHNGDMILLAALNEGAASTTGHARLVIMATQDTQMLAFPSITPGNFFAKPIGVDHDPSPGTRGPDGGALDCVNFENKRAIQQAPFGLWVPAPGMPVCYDAHEGSDFLLLGGPVAQGIGPFGVQVNAAASGVVLAVDATHEDKCFTNPAQGFAITCLGGSAPVNNFVAVRQDDGLIAHYVHVRRESVVVVPGQRIACGEMLANVGSAGDSAVPHLHFELRQLSNNAFAKPPGFHSLDLDEVRSKGDTVDPFGDPSGAKPSRWQKITNGMPEARCPAN